MSDKNVVGLTLIIFSLVSASIGAFLTYGYLTKSYYEVHESNIGGFIFKKGKAYSLEEIKDF